MHQLVRAVVEEVLEDEEKSDLSEHRAPVREGNLPCREAEVFCDWVEEPDLRRACQVPLNGYEGLRYVPEVTRW